VRVVRSHGRQGWDGGGVNGIQPAPHLVAILVPADFALFPVSAAVEGFAYPRLDIMKDWYDVRICSAQPGLTRTFGGRFFASITDGLDVVAAADTVIVPQVENVARQPEPPVIEALRTAYDNGARMVSFSSGAFALAAAGVLDGHRVATHRMHARRLAESYPRVEVEPDVLYIDDGQVLSSAGRVASIDLMLYLIRKDHGARIAGRIARDVVAYPHREGGQAQVVATPAETDDEWAGIRAVTTYALEHLDEDLSLDRMAARAHMSSRHFSRRFREFTGTTPLRWLHHQRLVRACELLEQTDLPIARVATMTGFRSAVSFRERFSREFLTTPSSYRRGFRGARSGRWVDPSGDHLEHGAVDAEADPLLPQEPHNSPVR
jgi:AraC family transcriptional activator FtrA